jgi:hypothetical protein
MESSGPPSHHSPPRPDLGVRLTPRAYASECTSVDGARATPPCLTSAAGSSGRVSTSAPDAWCRGPTPRSSPRLSRQTQDPEATAARTWPARAVGTVAPAWMRGSGLPRTMPTAVMRSSPARRRHRAAKRVMCWSSLGVGRPGAPLSARIRHRPGHDRDARRFCRLRRGRPRRRSRPVSRLAVLWEP